MDKGHLHEATTRDDAAGIPQQLFSRSVTLPWRW
jgi:hypothetical protein